MADALDYAHRNDVIHRDIKRKKILLHDGRPMVADFGIALAVSAAAGGRMTETGMSLGTPHYMSPEQATADRDITNRSDIYSLGSVLYEMLTGEPRHLGNSAFYRWGDGMYAVPVRTSAALEVGVPEMLFRGSYLADPEESGSHDYDVAADDRFLMVPPPKKARFASIVVDHDL